MSVERELIRRLLAECDRAERGCYERIGRIDTRTIRRIVAEVMDANLETDYER
jgi:hypothetical protein